MQGMGILAQNAGNVTITHNEVGVFPADGHSYWLDMGLHSLGDA